MVRIKKLFAIIVISLPLLAYWLYATSISIDYPYARSDPEYTYFVSSLALFKGIGYRYVDHPGTPVEMIGSALLGITYPFVGDGGMQGFIQYHIDDPRLFFFMAYSFLLVSAIVCAVYFYRTAQVGSTWEDSLAAVALALMFFAIYSMSFLTLRYWSHNSFSFPFGTLILVFLYRLVQKEGEISEKDILFLGLGSGILTAVVIYFCTWALGILITIGVFYWKQGFRYVKIFEAMKAFVIFYLLGFILAILPMLHSVYRFAVWITDLISHQGRYGSGEEGITSIPRLLSNFLGLYQTTPVLFWIAGITLVFFVLTALGERQALSKNPGFSALGIGLSFQLLLSIFVVVKHPATIYLSSVAAQLPVLVMVVKGLLRSKLSAVKIFNWMLVFMVAIGLVVNLKTSMLFQREHIESVRALNKEFFRSIYSYELETGRDREKLVIIWGQGVLVPCNTLGRMNGMYAAHAFNKELSGTCNNQYGEVYVKDAFAAVALFGDFLIVDVTQLNWDLYIVRREVLLDTLSLLPPTIRVKDLGEILIIYRE